jgi:hypothetical protein
LIAAACSVLPRSAIQLDKRGRSIRRLAEHLIAFPGETWQQRWDASGWESSATPLASLNPSPPTSWTMTSGFSWLVALRVLVPSIRVLRRNAVSDFSTIFMASQRHDSLASLVSAIEAAPVRVTMRNRALTELAYMLAAQSIPAYDITPAGIIHFGLTLQDVSTAQNKHERKLAGSLVWQVLADAGRFPRAPP